MYAVNIIMSANYWSNDPQLRVFVKFPWASPSGIHLITKFSSFHGITYNALRHTMYYGLTPPRRNFSRNIVSGKFGWYWQWVKLISAQRRSEVYFILEKLLHLTRLIICTFALRGENVLVEYQTFSRDNFPLIAKANSQACSKCCKHCDQMKVLAASWRIRFCDE
jgi:hypothetical protein